MQICLLAYRIGKSSGFGIERYGYEIYKRLKDRYDVELVEGSKLKLPQYISDVSYIPLKTLLNRSKIIHAVTPRESLFLPFVKKSVVTYHDFIPFTEYHSETRRSSFSKSYYSFFWKVGTKARHIIADSEQTKNELISFLNLSSKDVSVVNLGVDEKFRPLKKENERGKEKEFRTIGYLSSMVKRKRVDKAIEFFKRFQEKFDVPAKLEIYGSLDVKHIQCLNPFEVVQRLKVKNVEIKGHAPESKIVKIYNSFDLFLYPSDYEGFGLPIIEALSCGVPTIVREEARITSEVKELCIVANEENIEDIMLKVLTDNSYRKKMIRKSLEKVKKFNWDDTVKKLEEVYSIAAAA